MTIPGFTDQELADLARKKGASEESVRKWLDSLGTTQANQRAVVAHLNAEPAPTGDRGRTGQKRASTPQSEATVQREIIRALTNAGWRTWRVGQYNARRTQDAGVPDVYAMRAPFFRLVKRTESFDGRIKSGMRDAANCWIECKRSHGGRQSEAQREFQRQCEHAGVGYILARSLDDVRELL